MGTWLRTVSQIALPQLVWRARYQWERRRPVRRTWQFPGDAAPALRQDFPEMPEVRVEPYSDMHLGTFHHLNETRALGWSPTDWLLGPVRAGRLWAVTLHYHEWAYALACRGEVELFEQLVSSWIQDCSLETPGSRDLAWNAYAIATRMRWWIRSHRTLAGRLTPKFDARFLRSLWQQSAYLFDHLEWDLRANHLLRDLVGVAWAGRFFDGPESRRWLETAAALAVSQAAEQVLPDGGHFERSPMYHHHALADFRDLAALKQPGLHDTIKRMEEFAAWMRHPDGDVPLFNDAALGHASLVDLPRGGRYFPDTGMCVWHGPQVSVFFDVGPVGPRVQPGHAHADTLSVEISLGGRRLIVDPGTHSYDNDARRRYDRSTASHNTVCVDGADSSEVWHIFRVGRRALPVDVAVELESGMDARASHDGYDHLPGRPRHTRRVTVADDCITIRDRVSGTRPHVLEGGYLLDPGWTATPVEAGWILSRDGVRVRVRCTGPAGMLLSLAKRPYHPEFGVEIDTSRLCWRFDGDTPVDVTTVIERG